MQWFYPPCLIFRTEAQKPGQRTCVNADFVADAIKLMISTTTHATPNQRDSSTLILSSLGRAGFHNQRIIRNILIDNRSGSCFCVFQFQRRDQHCIAANKCVFTDLSIMLVNTIEIAGDRPRAVLTFLPIWALPI